MLLFEGVIQVNGTFTNVHVVRPQSMPDAALPCVSSYVQALSKWRYKPALHNGRAVPVYLTISVLHVPC